MRQSRKTIRSYELIDHGLNHSWHFRGSRDADSENYFIGRGNDKHEALEDAFNHAALSGWDYEVHASNCARRFHFMSECTCMVAEINAEIEAASEQEDLKTRQTLGNETVSYYVGIKLRGDPNVELKCTQDEMVCFEAIVWQL